MATTQLAGHLITAWYRDTLVYIRLASFTYQWSIPAPILFAHPTSDATLPMQGPFTPAWSSWDTGVKTLRSRVSRFLPRSRHITVHTAYTGSLHPWRSAHRHTQPGPSHAMPRLAPKISKQRKSFCSDSVWRLSELVWWEKNVSQRGHQRRKYSRLPLAWSRLSKCHTPTQTLSTYQISRSPITVVPFSFLPPFFLICFLFLSYHT